MTHVVYTIVEHDGGYAYKVGEVFSETFRTRDAATKAATAAAAEQKIGGQTVGIQYEDAEGNWHDEVSSGGDRPDTEVRR